MSRFAFGVAAAVCLALSVTAAQAALIVTTGNEPQPGQHNLRSNPCAGPVGVSAMAVAGCLNDAATTPVRVSSDEPIQYAAGGQARIEPDGGLLARYSTLTIEAPGAEIASLILNVNAALSGYIRFSDGVTDSPLFELRRNGENFFTVSGGLFDHITYTTFRDALGEHEFDLVKDTRQIRLRLQQRPTPVPEPAPLLLLAAGLIGLGLLRRRRAA